jgi:hypothetical protein
MSRWTISITDTTGGGGAVGVAVSFLQAVATRAMAKIHRLISILIIQGTVYFGWFLGYILGKGEKLKSFSPEYG